MPQDAALSAVFEPVAPLTTVRGDRSTGWARPSAWGSSRPGRGCPPSASWPTSWTSRAPRCARPSRRSSRRAPALGPRPRRRDVRRDGATNGRRAQRDAAPRLAGGARPAPGVETGAAPLAAARADEATLEPDARVRGAHGGRPGVRRLPPRGHPLPHPPPQATGVPRLVALATEVQSELSELIAHIAHPAESSTLQRRDARIVEALDAHDEAAAVAARAPPPRGDGARPGGAGCLRGCGAVALRSVPLQWGEASADRIEGGPPAGAGSTCSSWRLGRPLARRGCR